MLYIIALLAHALSSTAYAGQVCGSRSSELQSLLIPDNFNAQLFCPFPTNITKSVPFFKSCKKHDICYWTAGANRGRCDSDFEDDLIRRCRRTYKTFIDQPAKACCVAAAKGYAGAVRSLGQNSFATGQAEAQRVLDSLSASLDQPMPKSIIDLVALECYSLNQEVCPSAAVSQKLLTLFAQVEELSGQLLLRELAFDLQARLVEKLYFGSIQQVREELVALFPTEIIEKLAYELLGEIPEDLPVGRVAGVLADLGYQAAHTELIILYRSEVVRSLYREITGREIHFVWRFYYERRLTQLGNVQELKELMERDHG